MFQEVNFVDPEYDGPYLRANRSAKRVVARWFLSGAPDPRWDDEALASLKRVKGRDFEVVKMESIVAD